MTLSRQEAPRYRWVVLATYMYVSALSLLFWVNFASIETYMEETLHFSSVQVIWLAQVFLIAFFLLTIPTGLFIDKKGYKTGIGLGVILTGLFPFIRFINPESFPILLLSQIGIAIGQPFILNGITKITDAWFPPQEKGMAIGLASLSQTLGMVIAFSSTSLLVQSFSFYTMLVVYSIFGLIGIILYFTFVSSNPPFPISREPNPPSVFKEIRDLIKIKNFNTLSFIVLIIFCIISGLLTRIQKILHELHNQSLSEAGSLVAIFLISGIIGAFVMPVLSDKLRQRKKILNLCIFISILCFPIVMYVDDYKINLVNGIVLGFFLTATVPLMYTMSTEITGAERAGITVGYLQLLGCFSSMLIVPIMQLLWVFTGTAITPLVFVTVLLIIAFILSLTMKETYPKST